MKHRCTVGLGRAATGQETAEGTISSVVDTVLDRASIYADGLAGKLVVRRGVRIDAGIRSACSSLVGVHSPPITGGEYVYSGHGPIRVNPRCNV